MSRYEIKRTAAGALVIALGLSATGCLYADKEGFGDSVRHMQTVQTATPGRQVAPQDGERMREVLKTYREDIAKPQEIKNEITINVGEGRNN